ncbi:PP2C family protein-serine/threonine phosphatase [Streptomyces sp. NPDC060194]|uniref:PP2C family protein-serine/threonine phosphatase n=1 Tax=Streptomyces sp. NPDC060194 TaxID=3347069 RepID=UPI00364C850F
MYTTEPEPSAPGARPSAGPAPRVPSPRAPQVPADWRAPSVLLVEDDEGDAVLLEELFADGTLEPRTTWARSLADARRELARATPDCVLLDLHLPDGQGLDALATVLEQAGGAAVVVFTGLAEEATGLAAVAAGAQDYLVKGRVEPELLDRAIRYAIQRKQAETSAAALQAGQLRAQENARLERGLLPSPLLRTPTPFDVVARYRPGRAQALLGGDFYDVVERADGTVHVLIGDVSGHGPDEAALGVGLRIAWRTLVISGVTGSPALRWLEEVLVAERAGEQIFATLTTIELLPDRRRMRVVRAGHPGLLLRSGAKVEWLEVPGGPALGILPGLAAWTPHEVTLATDAGIVLFTDGLFEGRTGTGTDRLGEDGLLAMAQHHADLDPAPFVDALIRGAESLAAPTGGIGDDMAVIHLRWTPAATPGG